MNKQKKFNQQNSKLILEELEERRLFSGGIEGLISTGLDSDEQAIYADLDTSKIQTDSTNEEISASAAEQQSQEIVFVDAGVDNYQLLVDDLRNNADTSRNIEVVVLDRDQDGIQQISDALQDRDDLDAIHIISHGSDGSVQLGNNSLSSETLEDNNLKIALWANSFAETGDILIYGCNLAESEVGRSLISELSSLTLTDVAASDDLTGHENLGGDWVLEHAEGSIEATVAVSSEAQQQWVSLLAGPIASDATLSIDENTANGTTVTTVDASAGNYAEMYWVDKFDNAIYKANSDGTGGITTVLTGITRPVGLAIDYEGGKLYWTTNEFSNTSKIQSANLDGSGVTDLVTGLTDPDNIALDLTNNKMYWTDDGDGQIRRANLDGSGVESLVSGLTSAQGIALDVNGGKMYWTDYGTNKIQRANLDGSGVEDLVIGLTNPDDVELDLANGKMYWVDFGAATIQRANLDGSAVENLVTTGLSAPYYLALDAQAGKMYWTDDGSNKIQRANLDGSGIEDLVTTGSTDPRDLVLSAPNTLSHSIIGGNTGNAFAINASTGEITIADSSILDFETTPTFNLVVEVQDTTTLLTDTASITVDLNNINNAPVLSGANDLAAINEDDFNNGGTLVSDLISGQISDADAGSVDGIAVIGVDDTNGSWEYTTDGGGNWFAFGAIDGSNARLLAADANTYVRFVPDANWNGTVTNGITFHAWDQSSGTAGGTADLTSNASVLDQFNAVSYSGNDGTVNWTGNWQEIGEATNASFGNVRVATTGTVVAGPYLSIGLDSAGVGISREVDLSGATTATLSFTYEENTTSFGGQVTLEVFEGASWNTLQVYNIDTDNYVGAVGVFESFDISAYAAANTQVRFMVTQAASGDLMYIDDIKIDYITGGGTGGTSAFSGATASSSITVNDPPPVAVADAYSVDEDGSLVVDLVSGAPSGQSRRLLGHGRRRS